MKRLAKGAPSWRFWRSCSGLNGPPVSNELSSGGYVAGFSRPGTLQPSFHFIGVQVAEARAFAELEDGVPAESVNRLYPRLIARDPQSVAGFVCDAEFRDIGTPRDSRDLA